MPVSFQEALDRMMKANPQMSHGDAISALRELHDSGDPDVRAIPNIEGELNWANLNSYVTNFREGAREVIGAPIVGLEGMARAAIQPKPGSWLDRATDPERTGLTEKDIAARKAQVEPAPWTEGAGQLVGTAMASEGLGIGPLARALPELPWMPKIASEMAKSAAESYGLAKVGAFGDMDPGRAAAYGAIMPPAVRGLVGATRLAARVPSAIAEGIGKGVDWWLGEGADKAASKVAETVESAPNVFEEPTQLTRQGEYEFPPLPTEAPPPNVPPSIEPKPVNVHPGQPYQARTMHNNPSKVSGVRIFAPQDHPIYGKGPAYPRDWNKPLVIDVPNAGQEGWQQAAVSMYPNNPRIVARIGNGTDPEGLSQLLVARAAKKAGYDAVSLATSDPAHNIIMDLQDVSLKDLNNTKHPDLTRDLFQFQKKSPATEAGEQVFNGPKAEDIKPTKYQKQARTYLKKVLGREPRPEEIDAYAHGLETGEDQIGGVSPFDKARPAAGEQVHAAGDPDLARKVADQMVETAKGSRFHAAGDPDTADILEKQGIMTDNSATMNPVTREQIEKWNKRSGIMKLFPIKYMSDHPLFKEGYQRTMEALYDSNIEARESRKIYEAWRAKYPEYLKPEAFDELARAVHGLELDVKGNYVQSALNVSDRVNEAAKDLARLRDRGYTYLTGNDPRVPYLLEAKGIPHTRYNLERIQRLQTPEGLASDRIKPWAKDYEHEAARSLKGMLNFGPTHDLDFEPFTGWLTFHPHDNEMALIEDQISHFEKLREADPNNSNLSIGDQMRLEELLQRHQDLKDREWNKTMSRGPVTDFIPKKKWVSMLHAKGHPMFYSTDPDIVYGNWVNMITNKRVADTNLYWVRQMLNDTTMDGATKDRMAAWANVVRGATGYKADERTAEWINSALGHVLPNKVTGHDIHQWASTIQELNTLGKIHLSQIRFPIINLTHLFVTALPVAGPSTFTEGIMSTMSDLKGAINEALDAGVISHDSEWAKEIGDVESKFGKATRPLRYTAWLSENFRKAAAYRVGKIAAQKGEISPIVRGFIDKPGMYENETQRVRAYARAFVNTTQFELGKVDKPLAFAGGGVKRLALQFRSWASNLGGLYGEMLRQKQYKSFVGGMVALGMLGGARAVLGGHVYDFVRKEALRNGVALPDRPGYHYAFKLMGLENSPPDQVQIQSLTDPFGTDVYSWSSVFGPTASSVADLAKSIIEDQDKGQTYKIPKALIKAFAPQAQDAIEGAEEILSGGALGPGGVIDKNRPLIAQFMRGVDLQPSLASQAARVEDDLENAYLSGNAELVRNIWQDAQSRGIVLNPGAQKRIRAFLAQQARGRAHKFSWSDL